MTILPLNGLDEARALSGPHDQHLRLIRDRYGVEIVIRDLEVRVQGEGAEGAAAILSALLERARAGTPFEVGDVEALLVDAGRPTDATPAPTDAPSSVEGYRLRTPGQRRYAKAMDTHDVTFSIGPAGTGKTFLAVLQAVRTLKAGKVKRIILCRPAVEAGEHLGFLPGDLQAKVNPYMRPLYDSLYAVLDHETVKRYQEHDVVEVAPLAYMRGRTLNDAFIILDEAQNTTRSQMKMFLTRMGEKSRIVVTGDVTQIDLPKGTTSGLVHAQAILKPVNGIAFVTLTHRDIVRHQLVQRILNAYEGPRSRRK